MLLSVLQSKIYSMDYYNTNMIRQTQKSFLYPQPTCLPAYKKLSIQIFCGRQIYYQNKGQLEHLVANSLRDNNFAIKYQWPHFFSAITIWQNYVSFICSYNQEMPSF